MRTIAAVATLAALATVVILAGCSGSDNGAERQWVLGSWDIYAASTSIDGQREGIPRIGGAGGMTFRDDGTFDGELGLPGFDWVTSSGRWDTQPDGYVTYDGLTAETTRLYRDGDEMRFQYEVNDQTIWLWLRRA